MRNSGATPHVKITLFAEHGAAMPKDYEVETQTPGQPAGRCFPSDCKTRLVACTRYDQCLPLPFLSNCSASVEPVSAVTDDAPPEIASMMRSK